MTVRLGDRNGSGPDGGADDDGDDETWWDRHGWEVPTPVAAVRAGAGPSGSVAREASGEHASAEHTSATDGGFRWSTLLLAVAVPGGIVTLPVLGFTGGPGRVLTPTLWALIGLAVGVALSHREPRWDLGDTRRVEPLLAWALAYAVTATAGVRFFEGVPGWWVPATVVTALAPLLTAWVRRRSGQSAAGRPAATRT